MLEQFPVHATVAASDMERARGWYRDKLGMSPKREEMGKNTQAGWTVTGIESVMEALLARGVEFEEYDFGEMKTVNGLFDLPGVGKAAWFKDSEGNLRVERAGRIAGPAELPALDA
jgi:catechol 2,3-dioxygenase-like lactoylglutathione lyase family enzyme